MQPSKNQKPGFYLSFFTPLEIIRPIITTLFITDFYRGS